MDFRFADGDQWAQVYQSVNGAGVPSMQDKWNALFAPKATEEVKTEPVVVKKKRTTTKKATGAKKTPAPKKQVAGKKEPAKKTPKTRKVK
jgi:hypothetical protein